MRFGGSQLNQDHPRPSRDDNSLKPPQTRRTVISPRRNQRAFCEGCGILIVENETRLEVTRVLSNASRRSQVIGVSRAATT